MSNQKILHANNTRENAENLAALVGLRLAHHKVFRQPPTETFSVYDPNVPKAIPDTSTPLKQAIIRLEDEIRLDSMENGVVFDANGNVLLKKRGLPDRLEFTDDEVLLLKNRTFTHNHPKGLSFSKKDVLMAIDHDILEIRAVTNIFRYAMKCQAGRTWCSTLAFHYYHEQAQTQANRIVLDLVKTGQLYPNHVESEYIHYTWAVFAMYLELIYTREKS